MSDLHTIKSGLVLALLALIGIFLLFVDWYSLTDISENRSLQGAGKLLWTVAVLFLPVVGALCYFNIGKRNVAGELAR